MKRISVNFIGAPGDARDQLAGEIFRKHGGKFVNCGTFLATHQRNIEFDVPNKKADQCAAALRKAGLDLIMGEDAIDDWFVEQLRRHFVV